MKILDLLRILVQKRMPVLPSPGLPTLQAALTHTGANLATALLLPHLADMLNI